jgi:hypothetical protein
MENEINESDVVSALDRAGLRFNDRGRYWVSQCPLHDDRNPSTQIFKDDFFVNCLAGCGRYHITKAFPELKGGTINNDRSISSRPPTPSQTYQTFDLMETFLRLPLIPRDHRFKGIPLEVLDELGWRWDEPKRSYFIPYFNVGRSRVPFAQWRHLEGERRFTFLAGAKPTLYGKWNIDVGQRLFIVEGTSDAAVLQLCGVPWIAVPSASSGAILKAFAQDAKRFNISLVYAGDNDQAGNALKDALDTSGAAYRVCQPPKQYKDWGEFYEVEGQLCVFYWCSDVLFE